MATSQRQLRRAAMGQWVGRLGWSLALVVSACGEPEAQIQSNLPNGACPMELTTFPLTPGDYTVTEASLQGSDGCLLRPAALRGTRALVIGNQASQGGLSPAQGNTGVRLFDAQSGWLVKGFVRCNVGVLQSFSFNTQRNCQFAAHREAALQITGADTASLIVTEIQTDRSGCEANLPRCQTDFSVKLGRGIVTPTAVAQPIQ